MEIKEHDAVRLKDGREGVVVYTTSKLPDLFLVEIPAEDNEQIEVTKDDIEEVTWTSS